jgi:NAD+ synthase (glutamine-hydrolysing)
VNPTGIQNNGKNIFTFDGGSSVYKNGEKILRTNNLESKVISKNIEKNEIVEDEDMEQVLSTLVYGIREFLKSIHQEKVVI